MENKTLIVKRESFEEFKKGLINQEKELSVFNFQAAFLAYDPSETYSFFPFKKEEYYKKELLPDYDTVIFEVDDKTVIAEIEFTSTFTYRVEPYDGILVKLVLDSTNSVRK